MNMISTGAFQTEMDASNKQTTLAKKFAAVWEKKNAKAARAGGVSLMALSLAACGSDDTTTTTTTTSDTTSTTTVTDAAVSKSLTTDVKAEEGGSGADSFSGTVSGTAPTIQAGDSIDGKTGDDMLTISASGTAAVTMAGVSISNIETVRIADVTTAGTTTLNLAGQTGITTLESLGSAQAGLLTFTNVDAPTALSLSNTSGAGTVSVVYKATAVAGTADAQAINLDNAAGTGTVTIGSVENITITSSSASTLSLVASAASTVTVNGGAAANTIDLSSLGATKLTTVDASSSTGVQTITVDFGDDSALDAGMTVTGGSGADVFKLSAAMGDTDTLNGGDGIDTISVTSTADTTTAAIASNKATITSVEKLSLTAANDAGTSADDFTIDFDLVDSVTSVTLVAKDDDTANSFDLDDLGVQSNDISLGYLAGATGATVKLDMKDGTGTTDSATVNVTNVTGATTTIDDDNNNIESLTINVTSSATSAVINPDASSYGTKITVTGGETATTANARLIDMDAVALTAKALDMSGVKADTAVLMGTVDTTITGGDGADNIDMAATWTTKDTIDGGAGSDTLVIRAADAIAPTKATSTSNIEWLEVSGTINSAVAINADYWGGISNVRFTGTNTQSVVSNLKEGAEIELDGAAAATTLTLKAPNGTSDTDFVK
jgi:hypothetical protein